MPHGIANAVGNSLQDVFLIAAPIALASRVNVMFLREQPLRGRGQSESQPTVKPDGATPEKPVAT